jgi:glycine cleavage system aminomethyltransferase T
MKDGKTIGISTWVGYSSNEGKMLTLAMLDNKHARAGEEVTFVWGEQPGSGYRPVVESHTQVEIRATVAPVPYSEVARQAYRTT